MRRRGNGHEVTDADCTPVTAQVFREVRGIVESRNEQMDEKAAHYLPEESHAQTEPDLAAWLRARRRSFRETETVTAYEWNGARVWVRDSARRALLVIELFADETVEPEQKALWLPHMMFADPPAARDAAGDDPQGMVAALAWEAYGIDVTGDRPHDSGAAAFDWAQDAARIRASLMSAYGLEWDDASRRLSFCDLVGLLASLMETAESTPFAEAVSARLAKPLKPTKWNKEER